MSLSFKQLYEFGEYRLDPQEKILTRGDDAVELTPKGFELLTVFVENHGRLLEKDELMNKVWANSFVEEGNLAFNIRQLRKTLGDDAHDPLYIQTVRRHGYRFIADVKTIEKAEEFKPLTKEVALVISEPSEIALRQTQARALTTRSFYKTVLLTVSLLLVAAVIVSLWYVRKKSLEPHAPILSAPLSSEKLSTNGKVGQVALSPDGKKVIYVNGTGADKESLWLRQINDGVNTEIIPPTDDVFAGLAFSPDGDQIYFARRSRQSNEPTGIYRMSILGGIPQKVIGNTEGWISVSPDGTKISFVRCPWREEENCSLWIADAADGGNERKLVSRPRPYRIGGNRISPDNKSIAFAVGQSENSGNDFGLAEVNLETGRERQLTSEKFFNIRNIVWLSDQSGWLLTASRIPNINSRIWQVSAATGAAVPLTNDSETYSALNADSEVSKIVSTQIKGNFRMRLSELENPANYQTLADASSASFAPNGKIYFSSAMSGNDEIWSINPDGTGQRQLTNTPADEALPVVSPDNQTIFFVSNRTGEAQVWRMNPDGSNQTQLTTKEGGYPISVSADGEWLYYLHALNRTLWRVSTKGAGEQLVFGQAKSCFSVSPDGTRVAFAERQDDERVLAIASLADGQIVKTFHLADRKNRLLNLSWLPDGKNILYVSSDRDYLNNVLWMQPVDQETPRRLADLGSEELRGFGLAVSADAKKLALVRGSWLHDAVLLKGLL